MYRQHYPDDPGMHHDPHSRYSRPSYRGPNPGIWGYIKDNLIAIVVGMFLICVAFGLIFWNEGRAVQTSRSLEEGLEHVIQLHTSEVAFEHHTGKLVHLTGQLRTDKTLKDADYGIAVSAVKLRRRVEMYQWYEEEHNREVDDGDERRTETSYSYSTDWRRELIRSSDFNVAPGHHNPEKFPVNSQTFQSESVRVGNFYLSKDLIEKISNWNRVTLSDPSSDDPVLSLHQGSFYHGKSPSQPEVGDVRVTFEYAGLCASEDIGKQIPDEVSIVAKQQGNTLTEYETEAGDHLEMLYMGTLTPRQMFGNEMSQNTFLTWALRFAGWLLMFIGFTCLTRFLTYLVDSVPIIRELVNLGVASLNLTFSITLSLTVIALGWIRYRPWFGASVFGLALVPCIISCTRWRTRRRDYFDYRRSYYD